MITGLIYALFITACFQPTKPRLYVALTFTSVTLAHDIFLSSLDGFAYYGSAALGDLLIVVIISNIRPILKMTVELNKICMISIFTNLFGWSLWVFYFLPVAYNSMFVLIYAVALFTLIKRDTLNVGNHLLGGGRFGYSINRSTSVLYRNNNDCKT